MQNTTAKTGKIHENKQVKQYLKNVSFKNLANIFFCCSIIAI